MRCPGVGCGDPRGPPEAHRQVVAADDEGAVRWNVLQAIDLQVEGEQTAHIVHRCRAGERGELVGHAHGFPVAQNLIEKRLNQRPMAAVDELLSSLGNELVGDVL